MSRFAKGINLKNAKAIAKKEIYIYIYFNFHQVVYSLSLIS